MSTTTFKTGDIVRFKGNTDEWTVTHVIEYDTVEARYSALELVRRPKQKVKKRGWVWLHRVYYTGYGQIAAPGYVFATREQADDDISHRENRIACVEISWEEEES